MHRRHAFASLAALLAAASARAGLPLPAGAEPRDHLAASLGSLESRTGGRLGVCVTDPAGGLLLTHRADERFPMCSTFKVLAVAAVLRRAERGELALDERLRWTARDLLAWSPVTQTQTAQGMTVEALCGAALSFSDNTAANLLLARIGGPAAVTRFARELGDPVTRLDRIEPALNEAQPGDERDTTTPAEAAHDLRTLLLAETLSPGARARLLAWMQACRTGDDTLRAGLPPRTVIANKTGSGERGTRNDIGVVWLPGRAPIVVAAYLTGSRVDEPARSAALADIARGIARMS